MFLWSCLIHQRTRSVLTLWKRAAGHPDPFIDSLLTFTALDLHAQQLEVPRDGIQYKFTNMGYSFMVIN